MAGVQKIELVGGESWLEHNSVAIAAITAAALAALVAILNRRAELKHDRAMRNRDHLRETLDLSFGEVSRAIQAVSALMGVVHGVEEWREKPGRHPKERDQSTEKLNRQLEAAKENAHAATLDLFTTSARLEMRFGGTHSIAIKHGKFWTAIDALVERAPASLNVNRGQEAREEDVRLREASRAAYIDYREACFNWLNE